MGLAGAVLLGTAWTNMGKPPSGEHLEQIKSSPHYGESGFENALEEKMPEFWETLQRWVNGTEGSVPTEPPPIIELTAADFAEPPPSGLRITWLGHSTLLIEIDGQRVLTDPVWGERPSPWTFLGPIRFHAPPLPIDEVPPLDAIVISHDHYDHLDRQSIQTLAKAGVHVYVPLGLGSHLSYWGIPDSQITELDWWDGVDVGELRLTAAPSRHFSGRGLTDRNKTLWSGWAIRGPKHAVFFSGDTAMFDNVEEIGERLGPFDAAMVESGAYDAAWADVHLGPEQAVDFHRRIQGGVMIPIHWGTFDLALHTWVEPVERVLAAGEKAGVTVVTPRAGESFEPSAPPAVERWWPDIEWKTAEEAPVVSSGLAPR